jgi:hypothetical protein
MCAAAQGILLFMSHYFKIKLSSEIIGCGCYIFFQTVPFDIIGRLDLRGQFLKSPARQRISPEHKEGIQAYRRRGRLGRQKEKKNSKKDGGQ